jgi:hypothetical protein
VSDIFTKGSHHRNIIVVFTQNLFHQERFSWDISLITSIWYYSRKCVNKISLPTSPDK